jgi:hypothetical protein
VFVAVTLAVDEAVTLLKTGNVLVLVTVCCDSTHLTQTVLTNAFACLAKLLNANCLASFEVVEALVGVATARLAFINIVSSVTVVFSVVTVVSVCSKVVVSTTRFMVSVVTVAGLVTAGAATLAYHCQ